MIGALLLRRSWARVGALACLAVALASPQFARALAVPERSGDPAAAVFIPPGQEDLFAAMLGRGAPLPDACTFASGEIERTLVRGTYDCPGGEVVLELRHPSAAPADAARTEKIAIVPVGGTPPATLLAALQARIREREGGFEWPRVKQNRGTSAPGCRTLAPLPSFLDPYFPCYYPLPAAVLLGIAEILTMVLGLGYGLRLVLRTPRSSEAE